jgi:hypothetical protein
MSAHEQVRRQSIASSKSVKHEVNTLLHRAENLEQQRPQQYDDASILYRHVISLIDSHERTSTIDNELISIKRHANQRLLQISLETDRTANSRSNYGDMAQRASEHDRTSIEQLQLAEMSEQVFQDANAFELVTDRRDIEQSNGRILFQLDTGARLFHLAKDGSIKTTSNSLPLTIFQVAYVDILVLD